MFAYRIAVNYLVSDYINFKFFYLTWENPLMKNSLPNKVRDKKFLFFNRFSMNILSPHQFFQSTSGMREIFFPEIICIY